MTRPIGLPESDASPQKKRMGLTCHEVPSAGELPFPEMPISSTPVASMKPADTAAEHPPVAVHPIDLSTQGANRRRRRQHVVGFQQPSIRVSPHAEAPRMMPGAKSTCLREH